MKEDTIQAIAVRRCLELSEEEAMKVLIFIAGMDAGVKLDSVQSHKESTDIKD